MTAEVMATANHRKFLPILRQGEWSEASPGWVAGKYYVDLRGNPYNDTSYLDILTTIHGTRPPAPVLGKPFSTVQRPQKERAASPAPQESTEADIKITGIIVDEVTQPRRDGTRGSGLYRVPFRLSRTPDRTWAELFVRNWDHPPQFTTMHRPGISSVYDSKVILDGTTIQEVEQYHRDTLGLVIEETNRQWRELKAHSVTAEERRRAEHEEHLRKLNEVSRRLRFD